MSERDPAAVVAFVAIEDGDTADAERHLAHLDADQLLRVARIADQLSVMALAMADRSRPVDKIPPEAVKIAQLNHERAVPQVYTPNPKSWHDAAQGTLPVDPAYTEGGWLKPGFGPPPGFLAPVTFGKPAFTEPPDDTADVYFDADGDPSTHTGHEDGDE